MGMHLTPRSNIMASWEDSLAVIKTHLPLSILLHRLQLRLSDTLLQLPLRLLQLLLKEMPSSGVFPLRS